MMTLVGDAMSYPCWWITARRTVAGLSGTLSEKRVKFGDRFLNGSYKDGQEPPRRGHVEEPTGKAVKKCSRGGDNVRAKRQW